MAAVSSLKANLTRTMVLALLVACTCLDGWGGEIAFWHAAGEDRQELDALKTATQFYGIDLVEVRLNSDADLIAELNRIKHSETLGVVATSSALGAAMDGRIFRQSLRAQNRTIPIMIIGVTADANARQLRSWSANAVSRCRTLPPSLDGTAYIVGADKDVTGELAGEQMNLSLLPTCSFEADGGHDVDPVLSVRLANGLSPTFIRAVTKSTEIFLLSQLQMPQEVRRPTWRDVSDVFSLAAPFMFFVRHASGDYGWHSPAHYANLTIDDPWLIEPYGFLHYDDLLREMDKHNFHTTIAFIPWNFDRSEEAVVSLIRSHQNRFSIAIHGNNHDHREFDQLSVAPISDQEADIKQALNRMDRFSFLTGITYDPVMVFPHGIAPAATLELLKRYNFLATVNSQDVPLGSTTPTDPAFTLRPFTTSYDQFPSLMRYSAEVPVREVTLATNAFLGNPILLYGHHGLFADGSGAFNQTADLINRLEPGTHWCSLGCIATHLYLLRLNQDGRVDTMMLSSRIQLENPYQHEAEFVIHKQEADPAGIESVTVDGKRYPFASAGGNLTLTVTLPAGTSRQIGIMYRNDLRRLPDDYAKYDLRVMLLRRISDFRDLTLSKWSIGAFLTRLYYTKGFDDLEVYAERGWPLFAFAVLCLLAVGTIRRKKRSRPAIVNLSRLQGPHKH